MPGIDYVLGTRQRENQQQTTIYSGSYPFVSTIEVEEGSKTVSCSHHEAQAITLLRFFISVAPVSVFGWISYLKKKKNLGPDLNNGYEWSGYCLRAALKTIGIEELKATRSNCITRCRKFEVPPYACLPWGFIKQAPKTALKISTRIRKATKVTFGQNTVFKRLAFAER